MNDLPERNRLFSYLTRTRFLHIEDALERRKLRFFMGSFERGKGSNQTAYAYADLDEMRVVLHDLADGAPVEYSSFAGGKTGAELIISRVVKIRTKDGQVWIQVSNGPGVHQGGVIKPNGRAAAEISVPLTMFDGRKLGWACLAYLQVWEMRRMQKAEDRTWGVEREA